MRRELAAATILAVTFAFPHIARAQTPPDAGESPSRQPVAIEAAAGLHVFLDSEQEAAIGPAGAITVGVTARLGQRSNWLILDGGVVLIEGREFPQDATFELSQSRYIVVPVNVGIRIDLASGGTTLTNPVGFFVGAGLSLAWAQWDPPEEIAVLENRDGYTAGGFLELRPDVRLDDSGWRLFGRARLLILGDINFGGSHPGVDLGGLQAQVGLSKEIG